MSRFRDDLPDVRLIICGNGSETGGLKDASRTAGLADIVEFRGWVTGSAKMDAIEESDILVLPSLREGFPNVLLEAMAAGRPVIASAVGAIPDLVIHGRTGLLCEAASSQSLGEQLVAVCADKDLRHRIGLEGQQRVLQYHDIDRVWEAWLSTLSGERRVENSEQTRRR